MTVLSLSVLAVPECMTMIFYSNAAKVGYFAPLTMIGLRLPAVCSSGWCFSSAAS